MAVGIWGALWVERRHQQRIRSEEEDGLLQALGNAVDHNLELCKQLREIVTVQDRDPTFLMDVDLLDAIFPRIAQLSDDPEAIAKLNGFRYQLHHLNRKLDLWLGWSRDNWGPSMGRHDRRSDLRKSVSEHITTLQNAGQELRRLLTE